MFRKLCGSGGKTIFALALWITVFSTPSFDRPLKASWERTGAVTGF